MGVLAASITKSYLLSYKNELEYKMLLIRQSKISLTASASDLLDAGTDLDPANPMVKQLEQRKERLNALEKKLDLQLDDYGTKLKMIEDNIKACEDQMK